MDLIRPDSRADEKETDHDFGDEVEER